MSSVDDVKEYIKKQKAIVGSAVVGSALEYLGAVGSSNTKAKTIVSDNSRVNEAFIDNILEDMDRELIKKDSNFKIDEALRMSNRAIINGVLRYFERENNSDYCSFMKSFNDDIATVNDSDTPAISSTGRFAQSAVLSLVILYRSWQDVKFLQLCMTEGFSGTTYKMPVEFQSHDLFTEDDFTVDELEGIPTESIQTFLLEFGAQWLKRGFIVTKEAEKEMRSGSLRYDVISRNAANIAARFTRKGYFWY